jgi:MYXO-CTERM domain-containing protein
VSSSLNLRAAAFCLLFLALPAVAAPVPEDGPAPEDCGLEPPAAIPWAPVPPRANELPAQPDEPPRVARVAPPGIGPKQFGAPAAKLRQGALTGKTVYLSPGHGFYSGTASTWQTQRGNTFDVVEDLISTETLTQFLAPMLVNAGAHVVTMRESDLNTQLRVVDNGSADYQEGGPASTFSNSSLQGYGPVPDPLPSGTNPFTLGNNRLMEATTAAAPTASATWTLDVPADGQYNVYVSYTQFSYRVPDAHYAVRHAGGEAHFRVNQRRHGGTWVLLGRFFFQKGRDAQKGAVVAFNDASVVGNVSLDAVRLGGGMGLIDRGIGKSGRPRFEECARYHAQYMGAPASVYDNTSLTDRDDDISARSRFAAWDHEPGDDGVYVAWHTNACGTTSCTARGTETYVYGTNPPDGTYQFSGVAGSDALAQAVHGEFIQDIRGVWDPHVQSPTQWNNRGIRSAYFGELNPGHNPETPAILLEVAFHNNATDADVLKDPYFRYLAARAIAQGIIKYYAVRDGKTPQLPPEPPRRLHARNLGNGTVRVAWKAGPTDAQDFAGGPATSYVLYSSPDGFAWDDGLALNTTSVDLPLGAGEVRYFRVTGANAGGESFPSETVGVRTSDTGGPTPVLVVNGYERFDAGIARTENLSAHGLGSPVRVFIERMNDGSYLRRHGAALAALGVAFDGAVGGAVAADDLPLAPYALVDFGAGRGGVGRQLTVAHRDRLQAYVEGGGRLLMSGSHLAAGLAAGTAQDQQFLSAILRAGKGSGAGTLTVNGLAGESFDGITQVALDNGLSGAYPTGTADVLVPVNGTAIAQWGTSGNAAAVRGNGTHRVAFLAFPLETVNDAQRRADLMARVLTALEVPLGQEPAPTDGGVDGGATEPTDAGMELPDAGMELPDAGTEEPADGGQPPPEPRVVAAAGVTLGDEQDGCGCASGGGGALVGWALFAVAALARRRRRAR